MKLSYPVATPEVPGKVLGFSGNFEKNLQTIKEIGYEGVELLAMDASMLDFQQIEYQVKKHELKVVSIGTAPILDHGKLSLLNKDNSVRKAAMERTKGLLELAGKFECGVTFGRFRDNVDPSNEELCAEALNSKFIELCEYAEKCGSSIWLEPQNAANVNNLNGVQESIDWVKRLDRKNLGLLLDTFHMDITELSIPVSIIKATQYTHFIHLSDRNRFAPGVKGLDFVQILAALAHTKYSGYLSMEYKQLPDSESAARMGYSFMKYLNETVLGGLI
jgi:sugar phosphate isomerase/epimerase